jgi:hypothetical protein
MITSPNTPQHTDVKVMDPNFQKLWSSLKNRIVMSQLKLSDLYIGHTGDVNSRLLTLLLESPGKPLPLVALHSEQWEPSRLLRFTKDYADRPVTMLPSKYRADLPLQVSGLNRDGTDREMMISGRMSRRSQLQFINSSDELGQKLIYPLYDVSNADVEALATYFNLS